MQFVDFIRRVIHLAELFLNRLHLLVEIVLALAFFHLLLDPPADAFLDLKKINLRIHQGLKVFQSYLHISDLQNALLLF